jgi:hypothetical protein
MSNKQGQALLAFLLASALCSCWATTQDPPLSPVGEPHHANPIRAVQGERPLSLSLSSSVQLVRPVVLVRAPTVTVYLDSLQRTHHSTRRGRTRTHQAGRLDLSGSHCPCPLWTYLVLCGVTPSKACALERLTCALAHTHTHTHAGPCHPEAAVLQHEPDRGSTHG